MHGWWIAGAIVALGLALYWLLIVSEGTYLGARVVTLLYDWYAGRYDAGKGVSFIYEARFLGLPLSEGLKELPTAKVLDVATGTGRLPLALLREWDFSGTVYGIDRSRQMLLRAEAKTREYGERAILLRGDAASLPFSADVFDCVTCLEALEFMTVPWGVLQEMIRVLKPGGLLLISNRVGLDTWFFPARSCGRGRLERMLVALGLDAVRSQRWQVHYDLVWAHKAPAERRT